MECLYKKPNSYTYTNVYARISYVYRTYTFVYRTYNANIRTYTNEIRTIYVRIQTLYVQYTYAYVYVRIFPFRLYTYVYHLYIQGPKILSMKYTYVNGTNLRKPFIYFPMANTAAETEPHAGGGAPTASRTLPPAPPPLPRMLATRHALNMVPRRWGSRHFQTATQHRFSWCVCTHCFVEVQRYA